MTRSMNNFSIFCLIPAFDEMGNLEELTVRLTSVLSRKKIKCKILFVLQGNNNSLKIMTGLQKKYPQVKYIYFPKALGIGKAYQIGFSKVDKAYSHVLTMDADLNHQPEEMPKFISTWNKTQPDIIIGSRFITGGEFKDKRIWKKISSIATNLLVTKLLDMNVHDITSGFRLIKREVVEKIADQLKEKNYPSYMEFILLAQQSNFTIKEIPISYIPRKWGKSKMGKIATFLDYLFFLSRAFLSFKHPNQRHTIN